MRIDDVDGEATPRTRWRLHRGGVVNIWQYTEEVFDLSGGRVIFKGTNGSGKSRTLELLLPLCLDGDLRTMGCKGFDTVSMGRLMLDDYTQGSSRLGYAWVELRREAADGSEEFLTTGVGVKATASSRQVSDSWRFITPLRVNIDFALMEQDRPITPARLREHIGADAVVDEAAAFQERVAAAVYGIKGGGRYTDLLHLQRTLRNPDIGLKVLQGQLEQLLSDALPPIDSGVVVRTANGLDNLEGVRRNVARLRVADTALQEFLSGYRGYARGVLADRASVLTKAEKDLERARRAYAKQESEHAEAEEHSEKARADRDALTERREVVQAELDALKSSDAYRALGDLDDKAETVASQRRNAEGALRHAAELRTAEEQSVAALHRAAATVRRAGESVRGAAGAARESLSSVGLGAPLGDTSALVPKTSPRGETARVLLCADPGAPAEEVRRPLPPAVDVPSLVEEAGRVAGRIEAAARAVGERGPLLTGLRARAQRLTEHADRVRQLGAAAERAAEESADAAQRSRQTQEQVDTAAGEWTDAVREWRGKRPAPAPGTDAPELDQAPETAAVAADPESFGDAERRARATLQPAARAVQQSVLAAQQRRADAHDVHAALEAELVELRSAVEVALPDPELTRARRAAGEGLPFYRAVDFAADLPAERRAALEAALQASGLLNAWVPRAGLPDDDLDTWAVPGEPVSGPSLADLLRPAGGDEPVVSEETVRALLRSIPLSGDGAGGLTLSADGDGRWRAGVLHGRHAKDEAEHIGAGAREAVRRRRIAALQERVAEAAGLVEEHAAHLAHAEALERAWESWLTAFPGTGTLLTAHVEARTARSAARRAAADAERAEAEHARERAEFTADRAAHRRSCGDLGVAEDAETLAALCEEARTATSALEQCSGLLARDYPEALEGVRAAREDHATTCSGRRDAETAALEAHRRHSEAHAALETLRSTLGHDAEEVALRVRALAEERDRLKDESPKVFDHYDTLRDTSKELEGRLEAARMRIEGADGLLGKVSDAEDALTDAAGVAGVWEAATEQVDPPFERAELRTALTDALSEGEPPGDPAALERDLLTRIHTLQSALSGTHDVQADRHPRHGILTVTVSEESGTAPVAATARLTLARLEEAESNLTGREEQIFEDYLLSDIAEELRRQIAAAESLTRRMNTVLTSAHSSQGVRVELTWEPATHLDPAERSAFALAKKSAAQRSPEENERLRRALMDRIRTTRDEGRSSGYAEVLTGALDYRAWYAYRVRVHDIGPDGQARDRRMRQLSSGETRLVSYVTLFAASAAFYDALEADIDGTLRLVLLDEAFERLDDPTIARLLELLVDLDMDWAITWPSGYGVSSRIPRMHIYDILKRKGAWGVACARTTWNGSGFDAAA
ncbi:TIGR02680 family protein [Nocardiopsis ansamitocini]|uniref:Nuclease SbcCD subunit C n=1 Tax=Nocardiopsis ansamitocini TaxID=1670832 RepID=A0A9W6P315_9ACTN|nr:TIGR02680 family protein [Nocardiopsis ansamitocini]GLU46182.1 hypothetical protein Nans01_05330 [Nocardiopsis ansamitocini]